MNTEVMFSSKTNERATPQDLFDELNKKYHFTLDPCATPENAKCEKYYTKEDDGLAQDWTGERVFCNPPHGREIPKWVEKAATSNALTVMLITARTDTRYFHEWIYKKDGVEHEFIKGRLKFGGCKNSAPLPSMIVVFERKRER